MEEEGHRPKKQEKQTRKKPKEGEMLDILRDKRGACGRQATWWRTVVGTSTHSINSKKYRKGSPVASNKGRKREMGGKEATQKWGTWEQPTKGPMGKKPTQSVIRGRERGGTPGQGGEKHGRPATEGGKSVIANCRA